MHHIFLVQVSAIFQRDGPNTPSQALEPPTWVRFSKNIFGGFSFMLWLGALLCFAHYSIQAGLHAEVPLDDLVLGFSLIVCVLVTGVFSFVQERKEAAIQAEFDKLLPEKALVIRDGEELLIDASDLVLGDIVLINAGDQIAADIRIFETSNFKVVMDTGILSTVVFIYLFPGGQLDTDRGVRAAVAQRGVHARQRADDGQPRVLLHLLRGGVRQGRAGLCTGLHVIRLTNVVTGRGHQHG